MFGELLFYYYIILFSFGELEDFLEEEIFELKFN